jgi:bifunctional oligoribonuclease and PAP phosphatase NrnA
MEKNSAQELVELIDSAQTIGFMTHSDGDGDAFGSMLGLARIVETIGKKAVIFSNESLIHFFDFMTDEIKYQPTSEYQPVDLLIVTDVSQIPRLTMPEVFEKLQKEGCKTAVIDHHQASDIGDKVDFYWHGNDYASAAEMVFAITQQMQLKLDRTTATLILLGIESDTLSLQNETTKPESFLAVAELLRQGARLQPIIESIFGGQPIPMVRLLGRVLDRLKLSKSGIGVSYITLQDKVDLGLSEKASSGVANFLDQMKEAKVVMVLEELSDGITKVSMRSNGCSADVARLVGYFGGGGHKNAAGVKLPVPLQDLINIKLVV